MTLSSRYRILRPTLLVVLCYCLAMGTSYLLTDDQALESDPDHRAINDVASSFASLIDPSPELGPREVVRIQLRGLAQDDSATGILQCMHFASPDNRAITGPLERFGRMVRNGKFRALATPDRVLIGEPTVVNGNARVLVTLVGGKKLSSYVWVLREQTEAPYDGCWMTEAVFPLQSVPSSSNDEI